MELTVKEFREAFIDKSVFLVVVDCTHTLLARGTADNDNEFKKVDDRKCSKFISCNDTGIVLMADIQVQKEKGMYYIAYDASGTLIAFRKIDMEKFVATNRNIAPVIIETVNNYEEAIKYMAKFNMEANDE